MIKSRKFIAALALFVAATAFVFTNHTDFTAAKVKLGNGHPPPAAVTNGHPGVIIAQDDVHVGHAGVSAPTPSPFVAVKTMSGKDPAEVAKEIEQQDPEGLEMPPLEKGAKL